MKDWTIFFCGWKLLSMRLHMHVALWTHFVKLFAVLNKCCDLMTSIYDSFFITFNHLSEDYWTVFHCFVTFNVNIYNSLISDKMFSQ